MPAAALSFARRPREELYELKSDPDQVHNLASNKEYAKSLVRLRELLAAELLASGDPRSKTKGYDQIKRAPRKPDGKFTTERAYAMTDHKEYFAETSEAIFAQNDFFPFNRKELKSHDPEMFKLLRLLWDADH
ncbi:MAG: hypothetical protein ACJAQT_001282 [Akkermansiaceae bacterium]